MTHMRPFLPYLLLFISCPGMSYGKVVAERDTVTKTAEFEVTILPESVITINLKPKEWKDFKISEAIAHAAYVNEGDTIITSESDSLSQAINDLKQSIELQTLETKLLVKELEDERILSALALKDLQKEKARNAEDFQYFVDTKYGMLLKQYKYFLKDAEWYKKNSDEELKQLKAMYEADDLTEETEEIILKRAEYQSESAAWTYENAQEEFKNTTERRLPRQLLDKTEDQKIKEYYYAEQERKIPNEVAKLEIELKKKQVSLKRDEQRLEKLIDDEKLLTLTAPADGIFYYGVISNGSWSGGNSTEKFMKVGGMLPTYKDFACIIPDKSKLYGYAQVESKDAGALKPSQKGVLEMSSAKGVISNTQCREVRSLPLANGKFLATVSLPEASSQRLNHTGKAKITIEEKEDVLALPIKALKLLPSGKYQVSIKPAKAEDADTQDSEEEPEEEGETSSEETSKTEEKEEPESKSEKRIVEVGLFGDDLVEITGGIEEGEEVAMP